MPPPAEARAARDQRDLEGVVGDGRSVVELEQLGAVPDHGRGRPRQEPAEHLAQLLQGAEARVVIELDVRQHAPSRRRGSSSERSDSSASITSHSPLAPVRVRQALADRGADQPAGLQPGSAKCVRRPSPRSSSCRGCRRPRSSAAATLSSAEQAGRGALRHAPLARPHALGVLGRHGAGVVELDPVAVGQVLGRVPDAPVEHPVGPQRLAGRGSRAASEPLTSAPSERAARA